MSPSQAIFAGAVLIATSVFFVGGSRSAASRVDGPFQLMHHSNTTANAGVFRLDTASGEVSYCYLPNVSSADVVCSRPVK